MIDKLAWRRASLSRLPRNVMPVGFPMDAVVDLPMPPDVTERPSVRPRLITPGRDATDHSSQAGRNRKWLLLGAAVVTLAGATGAGVFLADRRHDGYHAGPVVVPQAVSHLPASPALPALGGHDHARLTPARDDVQAETSEVLAFRQPPRPAPATPALAAPQKLADVRAAHLPVPAPVPAAAAAVAAPAPAVVPASLPPVTVHDVGAAPRPTPADASDRAARLQAAPLASADQVQVLQLVTEEATLIRQQRQELAELRADQQALHQTVGDTLADYGRRLSLSEATSAVGQARTAAQAAVATAEATPTAPGVSYPRVLAQRVAADVPLGSRRYRVQAASPRLAMLADQDSGAQVAIAPGDILPGYGKVTAIMQYGTRWQISTEHGFVR